MDARVVLLALGLVLAVAWVPARYRYLRRRGRPLALPGVPWPAYLAGVVFFGGGGAALLYIGLTEPLGIATGFWLICGPFAVMLGLISLGTWCFAKRLAKRPG